MGTAGFKADLVKAHHVAPEARALEASGAKEVRAMRWEQACLEALAKVPAAARAAPGAERKNAGWKVAVAAQLKATTEVSNGWLAERLGMGSGVYVSKHVGRRRRGAGPGQIRPVAGVEGKRK